MYKYGKDVLMSMNCTYLACGEPTAQPNAYVLGGGTTVGSARQYNCDEQYELNDASVPDTLTVTCQSSGDWTPTNFQCVVSKSRVLFAPILRTDTMRNNNSPN